MLGEGREALKLAEKTLAEARQYELTWLVARSNRIVAVLLDQRGLQDEALRHYGDARRSFSKTGMRLELARTLREYGAALLRWYADDLTSSGEEARRRGLDYLREAVRISTDCGAELDRKLTEQTLAKYTVSV
jgi:hypothetical protein